MLIALAFLLGLILGFFLKKQEKQIINLIEQKNSSGPFLHKKEPKRRKPISRTDEEIWELEMRNGGKML